MTDEELDEHVSKALITTAPVLPYFVAWEIFERLALSETPWLCATKSIVVEVEASLRRLASRNLARSPDGIHWYGIEPSQAFTREYYCAPVPKERKP